MNKFLRIPVVGLALLTAFALVPVTALAEDESESHAQEEASEAAKKLFEQRKEAAEKRREEAKKAAEKAREDAKQLAEAFKRACENRRESYKTRLENIAERSQKSVEVLDKIVERIKSFKETKNLEVTGYEALLAEVAAKKLIVHDLQEAVKEQSDLDFNCERDAAFEAVRAFEDVLHQQITALKDYKTALKNLLVAVKTAAEKAEGGDDENE